MRPLLKVPILMPVSQHTATVVLKRSQSGVSYDAVIKPRYWPFVRRIHRSPVNSPHKGQWRGALMFSLICVWINGWVNNREAGDFRRHCTHYDIIVMGVDVLSDIQLFDHADKVSSSNSPDEFHTEPGRRGKLVSPHDTLLIYTSCFDVFVSNRYPRGPQARLLLSPIGHRNFEKAPFDTPLILDISLRASELPQNQTIASMRSGPVFCLLLGASSGCARPITGQVTWVTWPVIGWA